MVEGEVALRALVQYGRFPLTSVLLSDRRVAGLKDLLDELPDTLPIHVIAHQEIEAVVGFKMHRGVLGCGQRVPSASARALLGTLPTGTQRLVLAEAVSNTDNMGAIFRNVAALGGAAVLLDHQSCDPLYRKAIRVSSGQTLALPFSRGGQILELIEAVRDEGFVVAALTPSAEAVPIMDWGDRPEKIALMVGAEGPGLSAAALTAADLAMSIPMAPTVDSLNVATSLAVAMYGLQR